MEKYKIVVLRYFLFQSIILILFFLSFGYLSMKFKDYIKPTAPVINYEQVDTNVWRFSKK